MWEEVWGICFKSFFGRRSISDASLGSLRCFSPTSDWFLLDLSLMQLETTCFEGCLLCFFYRVDEIIHIGSYGVVSNNANVW